GARYIGGGVGEEVQMGLLLRKQIDGTLMRLAVDAHVGGCVEPDLGGCLDGAELGELEPTQEVLLDVAHALLDAPLLIGAGDVAGRDDKTIVAGQKRIAPLQGKGGAGGGRAESRV